MNTIKTILSANKIRVPNYQRGYSWETESEAIKEQKQTNVFLSDIEKSISSRVYAEYHFGHYLLEKKEDNKYEIIDGQQRLTTIVILLSALFNRLSRIRSLTAAEINSYECLIKKDSSYRFETIRDDDQLLKDYVIDQITDNTNYAEVKTESGKRIMIAFDFFIEKLSSKDEGDLTKMLNVIQNASCTIEYKNGI